MHPLITLHFPSPTPTQAKTQKNAHQRPNPPRHRHRSPTQPGATPTSHPRLQIPPLARPIPRPMDIPRHAHRNPARQFCTSDRRGPRPGPLGWGIDTNRYVLKFPNLSIHPSQGIPGILLCGPFFLNMRIPRISSSQYFFFFFKQSASWS